ncbi:MAG: prolyl oligopeptidase family serine peptidase [Vicinamibacterales bacterium]
MTLQVATNCCPVHLALARLDEALVAEIRRDGMPTVLVSPTREWVAFFHDAPLRQRDLAVECVEAGGILLNPQNRAPHRIRARTVELLEVQTGARQRIATDAFDRVLPIGFSRDGRYLALADVARDRTRLAAVACRSGRVSIFPYALDASAAAFGDRVGMWLGGGWSILCRLVPQSPDGVDGEASCFRPQAYSTGPGPSAEPPSAMALPGAEEVGRVAKYLTSQLASIDLATGRAEYIGTPTLFKRVVPSPRGTELLVTRYTSARAVFARAASGSHTCSEVWDIAADGARPHMVALNHPLGPEVAGPLEYGVPGLWHWHPHAVSTLVAVACEPDQPGILSVAEPFDGAPRLVERTPYAVLRFAWTPTGRAVWLEADAARDVARLCTRAPGARDVQVVWSASIVRRHDISVWRANVPEQHGERRPVWNSYGTADGLVAESREGLYLTSSEASDAGPVSMLERWHADTGTHQTIFRSSRDAYERVLNVMDDDATRLLTAVESRTVAPCCSMVDVASRRRECVGGGWPQAGRTAAIGREELRYVDGSGVERRLQVYLPAAPASAPHPFVIWIYPQIQHAEIGKWLHLNQYLQVMRPSPTVISFHGVGLCDYPDLPIFPFDTSDPASVTNQLVDGIRRIVNVLAASGLADPDRLAIGGYCIGAYAAVMLGAHTDLFRAVIACSGDYNLASRPLGGILSGHRRLWEAPAVFLDRSPLASVSRLSAPLLLVHGDRDRTVGAAAGRELYTAVALKGGIARYVSLPHEEHLYAAEESVLTVQHEILAWCDEHLAPRSPNGRQAPG